MYTHLHDEGIMAAMCLRGALTGQWLTKRGLSLLDTCSVTPRCACVRMRMYDARSGVTELPSQRA